MRLHMRPPPQLQLLHRLQHPLAVPPRRRNVHHGSRRRHVPDRLAHKLLDQRLLGRGGKEDERRHLAQFNQASR